MKNYKKGLLTAMVLAAMPLMAAQDKTIYVTTLVDEDGENESACSLREAIKTAKLDKSYGGCAKGRTIANDGTAPDVIQLDVGEYKLNRELVVESAITLYGKSPYNYAQKSPITNQYPMREALKSTISGQGKTRLINTLESQAIVSIRDVILKDGYSQGHGGLLYVAGPLSIVNSELKNGRSEKEGGAIYSVAQDNERDVVIEESFIQGNSAGQYGSVLAMDCQSNLGTSKTRLEINRSSIVENGSDQTNSILDFCGAATASLTNVTLAKNKTHANGHILRMIHQANRSLSQYSSLNLLSNTIVENTAKSVLYYDNMGSKFVGYNILAYNNGLSCEYALNGGKPTQNQNLLFAYGKNAIQTTGASACVLPELAKDIQATDLDVSNISMSSLLSAYLPPSLDSRYLGMYYPKNNQTSNDLVDVEANGCDDYDQRGVSRVKDATLMLNPSLKNSCDIGAIEARRLTAADIDDLKNSSLVETYQFFKDNMEDIQNILKDKNTFENEKPSLQEELEEFQNLDKYTHQYAKYRAIYINPFSLAMPEEQLNGQRVQAKPLIAANYDVTMKTIGVGELVASNNTVDLKGNVDPALKCEWKPDLGRIIMYRTDGKTTSATDSEYCSYTLKDKQSGATSAGVLKANFVNIAPIAKDDEYIIRRDAGLSITVNVLENDSDDGDGPRSTLAANKPEFYVNAEGVETPIRLVKVAAGLELKAERQGACPGSYEREICYGGKLSFTVKNNFSQFDHIMEYTIFDADGAISNTANIVLKNDAKDTNTSSRGGGGALGGWGLFGLMGLVLYRRFKA